MQICVTRPQCDKNRINAVCFIGGYVYLVSPFAVPNLKVLAGNSLLIIAVGPDIEDS